MIIEIKAKYPIEWDKEYYLVGSKAKSVFAPCIACDNKGRVEIKGEEYKCPRCHGGWRDREVVSTTHVFHVEKYKLERIEAKQGFYSKTAVSLYFKLSNSDSRFFSTVNVRQLDFETMKVNTSGSERYLLDDYKEAMRQAKAANATEKAKTGKQKENDNNEVD